MDVKSDVERKFHLSHAAPAADKSPELVRQVQSNRLPKPIVKLRSCLWSGFVGYSRTGTAALLHPRAPFKDVWLVLWFVKGRLEPPDEFPSIIAQLADKNRTISRSIENTGGSGRPKTVKR